MAQQHSQLDSVFQALADPTRRAVITRLGTGSASISTLAEPFDMALPSFMKHIHALEEAGLIHTRKDGRVRTASIDKDRLRLVSGWLDEQRALWEERTDRLEHFVIRALDRDRGKMTRSFDKNLDLELKRIIKAPRAAVWAAWTTPASFEQWWIPAPALCRVAAMELRPGGALITEIDETGTGFTQHLSACYLAIEPDRQLVFTNALTGGWRPAEQPFITAVISLNDHPDGTEYYAHVMHKSDADRTMHEQLGFYDGWGTVAGQLAQFVERQVQ